MEYLRKKSINIRGNLEPFQFTLGELKTAVEDNGTVLVEYEDLRKCVYLTTCQYRVVFFFYGKQREVAVLLLHNFVAIVEGLSFTIAGEQGNHLDINVSSTNLFSCILLTIMWLKEL